MVMLGGLYSFFQHRVQESENPPPLYLMEADDIRVLPNLVLLCDFPPLRVTTPHLPNLLLALLAL